MKSLCFFGMATSDSYVRAEDDGAGRYVGWGTGNRDLPIRKVHENHWEFRFLDTTANLYLAAAAILAAGRNGIRKGMPLAYTDCTVFPRDVPPGDLRQYGITERMSRSLWETLDIALADDDIRGWIGDGLNTHDCPVNHAGPHGKPDEAQVFERIVLL